MPHYGLAGVMTVETETVNARPLNPADFDRHFSTLPQFLTVGAASLLVAKKQKSSSNKKKNLSVEPPVTACLIVCASSRELTRRACVPSAAR